MKLLLIAVCIQVVIAQRDQIQWNDVATSRWAHDCDFPTKSFYQVSSEGKDCGGHCAANITCTHFYWKELTPGNGICYLKAGKLAHCDVFVANGGVCGYFRDRVDEHQTCLKTSNGGVRSESDFYFISIAIFVSIIVARK